MGWDGIGFMNEGESANDPFNGDGLWGGVVGI